jgi:hypothetical protein
MLSKAILLLSRNASIKSLNRLERGAFPAGKRLGFGEIAASLIFQVEQLERLFRVKERRSWQPR